MRTVLYLFHKSYPVRQAMNTDPNKKVHLDGPRNVAIIAKWRFFGRAASKPRKKTTKSDDNKTNYYYEDDKASNTTDTLRSLPG